MATKALINVTEFKAKCLSIFDEIETSQRAVTVTRRGKPLVVVTPAPSGVRKFPFDTWAQKGQIVGDIVNTDGSRLWEATATTHERE